jgi:hypothetical protein
MTVRKRTQRTRSVAKSTKRSEAKKSPRTFWDDLADIGRRIPDEELARHPRDGARNLEHYLYGAPKRA